MSSSVEIINKLQIVDPSIDLVGLITKYNFHREELEELTRITHRTFYELTGEGQLAYAQLVKQMVFIVNQIEKFADKQYNDSVKTFKSGTSQLKKMAGNKKKDMAMLVSHLLVELTAGKDNAITEARALSIEMRAEIHRRIDEDLSPTIDAIIDAGNYATVIYKKIKNKQKSWICCGRI